MSRTINMIAQTPGGGSRGTGSRRLAAVFILALSCVIFGGGQFSSAGPAHESRAASQRPVVGKVTSLGGSGKLFRAAAGQRTRLHRGDTLHLADRVLVGAHVKTELKVSVPKGVSADRQLIFADPIGRSTHRIRLDRIGKKTTWITIGD